VSVRNNFSVLVGEELKDPECLSCHTTGYGKGGYEIGKAPSHNSNFENVQCESCHGPGGDHMKAPKSKKKSTITRTPKSCAECHNPHIDRGELARQKREKQP